MALGRKRRAKQAISGSLRVDLPQKCERGDALDRAP